MDHDEIIRNLYSNARIKKKKNSLLKILIARENVYMVFLYAKK